MSGFVRFRCTVGKLHVSAAYLLIRHQLCNESTFEKFLFILNGNFTNFTAKSRQKFRASLAAANVAHPEF